MILPKGDPATRHHFPDPLSAAFQQQPNSFSKFTGTRKKNTEGLTQNLPHFGLQTIPLCLKRFKSAG